MADIENGQATFTMPSLGADMDEGKLTDWLVKPGDVVAKGDPVAVVDTAKAEIEVECFDSGTIEALLVEPGTTVAVGTPLATIVRAGAVKRPAAKKAAKPTVEKAEKKAAKVEKPAKGPLGRRRAAEQVRRTVERRAGQRISPYARKVADELGVDLAAVEGTGRDGAVRVEDVRRAVPVQRTPTPEPVPNVRAEPGQRLDPMREAIALLMARSKREIPHYYLHKTIDVTDVLERLHALNRRLPVPERVLPASAFLLACATAARKVPELNGYWRDDRFIGSDAVHLGVAVSLRGGGLVTPAITDAETKDLTEINAALRDVATRARSGRLRRTELTAGTITVTNLGDLGVDSVYGVIFPPQVALVGIGKVLQRPWAVNGLLGVRSVVTFTLSADHRATDGHVGAAFLGAVELALQEVAK